MDFTAFDIAGLVVLGTVAGLFAGLLGLGGGVISVPGLTLVLGVGNVLLVKGIVFFSMLFTAGASAARHLRSGLVLPAVVLYLMPMATVGVALGYWLSRDLPLRPFRAAFGVFLVYVVAMNASRILRPKGRVAFDKDDPRADAIPARRALWIGGPMGLVAGLLSIGGGALAGPALQVFARMPLKNAIACSSVSMIPLVVVAASLALYDGLAGNFGVPLSHALAAAGLMIPGSVVGAWVGAWLTKVLPVRGVRVAFVLVMAVTAFKMLQSAWSG